MRTGLQCAKIPIGNSYIYKAERVKGTKRMLVRLQPPPPKNAPTDFLMLGFRDHMQRSVDMQNREISHTDIFRYLFLHFRLKHRLRGEPPVRYRTETSAVKISFKKVMTT